MADKIVLVDTSILIDLFRKTDIGYSAKHEQPNSK